jgi:hypothetical protein
MIHSFSTKGAFAAMNAGSGGGTDAVEKHQLKDAVFSQGSILEA